jgi:hypothetical protein
MSNYLKNIDGNPEFGCELACTLPYTYYLHKHGKLGSINTVVGMKPFYFFTDKVYEVYKNRSVDNLKSLKDIPNKWIHHNALAITGKDYNELNHEEQLKVNGVLDYREWIAPPIKSYYSTNNDIDLNKKFIVICNRFNMEHGRFPFGYFDINLLQDTFDYLRSKGYVVIYKRPDNKEFPLDLNEQMGIDKDIINKYGIKALDSNGNVIDDKQLCKLYDDVYLFEDIHALYPHLSYNEFQLKLFSKSDGFISMGGGNTILSCYFEVPVISYITTSKELRDNYFNENSYYRKLSNCDVYPIRDPEKEIEKRGFRNYNQLVDTIQKVF